MQSREIQGLISKDDTQRHTRTLAHKSPGRRGEQWASRSSLQTHKPRAGVIGQHLSYARNKQWGVFWTLVQTLVLLPGCVLVGIKRLSSLSKFS